MYHIPSHVMFDLVYVVVGREIFVILLARNNNGQESHVLKGVEMDQLNDDKRKRSRPHVPKLVE